MIKFKCGDLVKPITGRKRSNGNSIKNIKLAKLNKVLAKNDYIEIEIIEVINDSDKVGYRLLVKSTCLELVKNSNNYEIY